MHNQPRMGWENAQRNLVTIKKNPNRPSSWDMSMVICTRLFCFPPFPQFKMNLTRNWDLDTEEELCRTVPTTQRAAKYLQPLTAFAPHRIIPCNSTQTLFLAPLFNSFLVHPEFHHPVPSPGVGLCYSFSNSSPSDIPSSSSRKK